MPEIVPIRLSELNARINGVIQKAFSATDFWVIADITNHSYKAQKNYHNFELVEKDPNSNDIIAKISGKAWGSGSLKILNFEKVTGQKFTNNINVLINVSVNFHAVYGLQINLNEIDTNFTLGVLEQQRQNTLGQLVRENPTFIEKIGDKYITRNNQLPLPVVIQKIAVISSKNSAGGEDFSHTISNNSYGYKFHLDFYYTEVQGEINAELFLNKIIGVFNSKVPYDVVVITRGGGAQTDFLIFDNYKIGRAIAKFPIPIITGIGHQKNETITDLMAHTQTKTPTQAAEFIIAHNRAFEEKTLSLQKGILIRTQQLFSIHFQALSLYTSVVVNHSRTMISKYKDSLVRINQITVNESKTILFKNKSDIIHISSQLVSKPKIILNNLNKNVEGVIHNINTFNAQFFKNQKNYLQHHRSVIRLMSPENILKKGFAMIKVKNAITSNPENIKVGEEIDIILADTQIRSEVIQKSKYDGSDFNL